MANFEMLPSYIALVFDIRIILIGLFIFLLVSWIIITHRNGQNQVKNLPPGPMAWPVIGCLPQVLYLIIKMRSIHRLFVHFAAKYGHVCYIQLPFGLNVVFVSGYKAVFESLTSPNFSQRPPSQPKKLPSGFMNGSGIMMSSGKLWKEHRKLCSTALRSSGIGKESFEDTIITESEYMMKEIASMGNQSFDPTTFINKAVSNIICSVIFGKQFEYDDPEYNLLLHSINGVVNRSGFSRVLLLAPRLVFFLIKIPFVPKGSIPTRITMYQKLHEIINDHHSTFDAENMRDLIDLYLHEMQVKTNEGVPMLLNKVNLCTLIYEFFLVGAETTTSTLQWALLYMLAYPDVQKRVHEEIDSVVGQDRLPRLSDKSQMPYTVAVINEIQRYTNILTLTMPRYADEDISDFQGFSLPKGTYVQGSFHSALHDASVWQDPDEFKPERFLDELGNVLKTPENMVFGAGQRICVGEPLALMELFIYYTHLMHRFTFEKPAGMDSVNMQPKTEGMRRPYPFNVCAIRRT